jgi:hypothetical protein
MLLAPIDSMADGGCFSRLAAYSCRSIHRSPNQLAYALSSPVSDMQVAAGRLLPNTNYTELMH